MKAFLAVCAKELVDALRDRRAWTVVLLTSVMTGPIVMFVLATVLSDLKTRAERREIVVAGAEHAPGFANFLQRQSYTILPAPPDFEDRLRAGVYDDAVVVVPRDFAKRHAAGLRADLQIVHNEKRNRSLAAARSAAAAVRGYIDAINLQRLVMRGTTPELLKPVTVQYVDVGGARGQAGAMLAFVPFIAMFAAIAGAMSIAIDVTSGERERGSLEPLLMNPISPLAIVLGKWVAVSAGAIATLVLSLASFVAVQRLIDDEQLASMFQFGPAEFGLFVAVIAPFCVMMAALLMATSVFARTFKEAQAYASYLMTLLSFGMLLPPLLSLPETFRQLLIPALGQNLVLTRALRGAEVTTMDVIVPGLVAVGITIVLLAVQARLLKREAVVFAKS